LLNVSPLIAVIRDIHDAMCFVQVQRALACTTGAEVFVPHWWQGMADSNGFDTAVDSCNLQADVSLEDALRKEHTKCGIQSIEQGATALNIASHLQATLRALLAPAALQVAEDQAHVQQSRELLDKLSMALATLAGSGSDSGCAYVELHEDGTLLAGFPPVRTVPAVADAIQVTVPSILNSNDASAQQEMALPWYCPIIIQQISDRHHVMPKHVSRQSCRTMCAWLNQLWRMSRRSARGSWLDGRKSLLSYKAR
jgi:hypothetical protein